MIGAVRSCTVPGVREEGSRSSVEVSAERLSGSEVDASIPRLVTEGGSPRDEDGRDPLSALLQRGAPDDADPADPAGQAIRERIRAAVTGGVEAPARFGRLAILHEVGAGGMGTVYAAYDPELDRKVALKVVRPERAHDERATTRMLREAQALAKLSHPNLVPVFEVGRADGQIHLVMELVHGATMRSWIADTRPRADAIVRHWLDVARALVAVHGAGLVHRDVKPSNVLIGEDGRARLVDFGLARAAGEGDWSERTQDDALASPTPDAASIVAGTPAYMPPEVFGGAAPDAAADQYSLCVSVYESLFGERPAAFELEEPSDPEPREGVGPVPRRVVVALRRGHASDPARRFESMEALVDALERGMRRPWRTRAAWASAVAVAGGLGALSVYAVRPPAVKPACTDLGGELDVQWNDARRGQVSAQLEGADLPYASTLAAAVTGQLDAWSTAWMDERRGACEATHVQHVQSPARLDGRVACLERQRLQLDATVDALVELDPRAVSRAVDAVAALPVPTDCAAAALVRATYPRPGAAQRDRFAALERAFAHAAARQAVDEMRVSAERLRTLRYDAEAAGHLRVAGEASVLLGDVLVMSRDLDARASLEQAENIAEAHDDLLLRERARRGLDRYATEVGGDLEAAWRAVRRYEATVQALGAAPHLRVRVHTDRGRVQLMAGEPARAEAELGRAVEAAQETGALADRNLVNVLALLAIAQSSQGRPEEALATFARAREVDARWGIDRLDRRELRRWPGTVELHEANAMLGRGAIDEAQAMIEAALDDYAGLYGRDSLPVAEALAVMVSLELRRGNTRRAQGHAERADAIAVRWLGPLHERRIQTLSALGAVAFDRGRLDDALATFEQALAILEGVRGKQSLDLAYAHNNVGETLVMLGRGKEARPHLKIARAGLDRHLRADDVQRALPIKALALLDLEAERYEEAATALEEALGLHEASAANPLERARTQWALARARAGQGRVAEARALAAEALETYGALDSDAGEALQQESQEIRALLEGGDAQLIPNQTGDPRP